MVILRRVVSAVAVRGVQPMGRRRVRPGGWRPSSSPLTMVRSEKRSGVAVEMVWPGARVWRVVWK